MSIEENWPSPQAADTLLAMNSGSGQPGDAPDIGRIERVSLREVWPHEALDFTPWLESNPDALSEVLDFPLENVERERSAGDFSVDLVAEDQSGNVVVMADTPTSTDSVLESPHAQTYVFLHGGGATWRTRLAAPVQLGDRD